MISRIVSNENVYQAYLSLNNKRNTSGKDGMLLSDVWEYYQLNKDRIINNILNKKYKCQTILLQEILDYKGKRKMIAKMCAIDRLLSKAITQVLSKELNNYFSKYSFAYRENMGVHKAIDLILQYVKDNKYVCYIDIANFFDDMDHEILLTRLHDTIDNDVLENFIYSFIECEIEYDYIISYKSKGLIQGNSLSPLLSNLYLNNLDKYLEEKKVQFVRFSDDIYMFFNEKEEAYNYMNHVKQLLENRFLLTINKKKSGVFKSDSLKYLGFYIKKNNKQYEIIKSKREKKHYYSSWYTSPIRFINHQYHLIDDGIIRKRDYHLLFENEQQKVQIPIEVVDHINIHSNIIFSSSFFEILNDKKLIMNLFDKNGIYIGQFIPNNLSKGVNTTLNQATIYNDKTKRLCIAKKMINASIHNERANIKYYNKHLACDDLRKAIDQLTECLKKVNECLTYEELLLIEARAKYIYYQTFNIFIENNNFRFNHRTRRPPMDRINALISFGNTILYNLIANEIYKTTLDIRIGYLHASNNRKQSLNLDLADIFKPIIVDRVIFTMINKRIINKNHFVERNKGIYLNQQGKSIFLKQINNKLYTYIKYNNKKITYYSLIRNNIYTLLQHINNNRKLKLYKYQ